MHRFVAVSLCFPIIFPLEMARVSIIGTSKAALIKMLPILCSNILDHGTLN